jgi:hypothetical protein
MTSPHNTSLNNTQPSLATIPPITITTPMTTLNHHKATTIVPTTNHTRSLTHPHHHKCKTSIQPYHHLHNHHPQPQQQQVKPEPASQPNQTTINNPTSTFGVILAITRGSNEDHGNKRQHKEHIRWMHHLAIERPHKNS